MMRWTQENEQNLWRTIFATQTLHLDLDAIAEAWPGDEKPTAKALSEQLYKYRKYSKGTNTVTLSRTKRKAGESNAGTPRKKISPKKATPKKGGKVAEAPKIEKGLVKEDTIKEELKEEGSDGYA